jgi:predicted RND superfamily exporter protein
VATARSPLERVLRRIVALRVAILVGYALLVPLAALLASRIPSEGAIDRLIVSSDPDVVATRAFQRVFPEGQLVMLLLEADDPWQPSVLSGVATLEQRLRSIRNVTAYSVLDVYRRARPGFVPGGAGVDALRRFATGTSFFRRQGLVGDHFVTVVVAFPADRGGARDAILAAIDRAVAGAGLQGIREVRRVGAPYVEAWIEHESGRASVRTFPLFGVLVVGIALFLYRSVRSLLAIVLTLASAVALGVAAGWVLGFSFTVISTLVPLTIMVTALATLVYLHSRFVDQPEDVGVDEHQIAALSNKFLPVTASTVAAVLGFSALAVSPIRPIREMGIWTAIGLALSWTVAFTLFPALQKVLRTPTGTTVPVRARLYDQVATALPGFTWRARWPLLAASLLLSGAGLAALFGFPGVAAPMRVGVDSLDYVDPDLAIYRDMAFFRQHVSGLNVARVWVRTPPGAVTDPEVLRGLDRFVTAVEQLPDVSAVVGPTTFLRMRRYLAGQGEQLPGDPAAFAAATADMEQLLLTEPELRAFVDVGSLANAAVTVTFNHGDAAGYQALSRALREAWDRVVAYEPAFRGIEMQVVGESLVQAKVGASLVPTLTESFAITAALIFVAFLFVFRSATARVMAMIPSVFAILVTFLGMRLMGASLNVATILIATTVLGTTENDQIHFFHHLNEGEGPAGLDGALRHALRVSGRAIVFATLINAAGFLGLASSRFPPLRQFGIVTAAAFLLAMLADFTALLAALWIFRRERPHAAPRRER